MKATTRYYGILKNFNFNNINKDTFLTLINAGIFEEHELSKSYQSEKDYFGVETISENTEFNTWFIFKRKEYCLKDEIILEIISNQINSFKTTWLFSNFEDYIEEELHKEFTDEKKIELLQSIYYEQYAFVSNKVFYSEYQEIKKRKDPMEWFNYIQDELDCGEYKASTSLEKYLFIANFLNGKKNKYFFPEKICLIWKECYFFDKVKESLENYKNKILKVEMEEDKLNKDTSKKLDTSKQILLLEEILSDNNWSDYSASKKGRVVAQLINKNSDNIKKFYAEIHKKPSESKKMNTEKFKEDKKDIKKLYEKLIG